MAQFGLESGNAVYHAFRAVRTRLWEKTNQLTPEEVAGLDLMMEYGPAFYKEFEGTYLYRVRTCIQG